MRTEVTLDKSHNLTEDDLWEVVANKPTQLDRIEAKLDELLARKKGKAKFVYKVSDYPTVFEGVWVAYPKRVGSNPKRKAFQAWTARTTGKDYYTIAEAIYQGVVRYAAFCDATGKTGTEYVMQAATFFGPDKHYENDWAIPAQKVRIPADNDEMLKWAIAQGMRQPREGESWQDYRRYVTEKVQS